MRRSSQSIAPGGAVTRAQLGQDGRRRRQCVQPREAVGRAAELRSRSPAGRARSGCPGASSSRTSRASRPAPSASSVALRLGWCWNSASSGASCSTSTTARTAARAIARRCSRSASWRAAPHREGVGDLDGGGDPAHARRGGRGSRRAGRGRPGRAFQRLRSSLSICGMRPGAEPQRLGDVLLLGPDPDVRQGAVLVGQAQQQPHHLGLVAVGAVVVDGRYEDRGEGVEADGAQGAAGQAAGGVGRGQGADEGGLGGGELFQLLLGLRAALGCERRDGGRRAAARPTPAAVAAPRCGSWRRGRGR